MRATHTRCGCRCRLGDWQLEMARPGQQQAAHCCGQGCSSHLSAAGSVRTEVGTRALAWVSSRTRATQEQPSARCLFRTERPTVAVATPVLEKALE